MADIVHHAHHGIGKSPAGQQGCDLHLPPGGQILPGLCQEVVRLGGSISGEHGVGSDKRCYLDWMFSPDDLATMQLVRRAFDPEARANPGKIFPTPRTCAESARRVAVLEAQGVKLPAEVVVV